MLAFVDMRPNLAMAATVLLIGGLCVYALSRRSGSKGTCARYWICLVALIAGPIVAFLWWAVGVFLLDRELLAADAWALLPPVMLIGTLVGTVSAVVFGLILRCRSGSGG